MNHDNCFTFGTSAKKESPHTVKENKRCLIKSSILISFTWKSPRDAKKGLNKSNIKYLAASPTHTVETSGRICLIVSNMAIPTKITEQDKQIIINAHPVNKIQKHSP